MKILHITPYPKNANGIKVVVDNLSSYQRNLGNQVVIWRVNRIGDNRYPSIKEFLDVGTEIDKYAPDIVIFHSVYFWDYLRIARLLNSRKIPYLIQLHGALSHQNYKKSFIKKYIANILFFHRFIRKAVSIIYLNNEELKETVVTKWNKNFLIIPNGCEIHPQIYTHSIYDKKIVFLFVGRIDIHHKGLDLLIDAFRFINRFERCQNIILQIYGTGNDKDITRLNEMITGFEDTIKFNGGIYGQKKIDAIHLADVFVHTSRYEGMPMSVLEALGCGIPCLLTPGTNMAQIVEEAGCGWATDPIPEKIAEKIISVANIIKGQKHVLAQNAINLAKCYSWEKIADLSIEQYKQLINVHSGK